MPLFMFILIFSSTHSFHYIHTVHLSVGTRRGSSLSPHRWTAQREKPLWGAEPGIELGPALQQADALPAELRRTLSELRRDPENLTFTKWRRYRPQ
jgi:hypothetical protein